jgi:serine/threonine-protein kinase
VPADQADTAPPGALAAVSGLAALGLGPDTPGTAGWAPDGGGASQPGAGDRDHGLNHTLVVQPAPAAPGDDGYPGNYPGRRGRGQRREPVLQRWLFSRRLLYVALVIALAAAAGLGIWWVINGQYSNVPRVSGMTVAAARSELSSLGFTVRTDSRHSQQPKGKVIGTAPRAGSRAGHGSAVTLIVSLGPRKVIVPQVTGTPVAAARAALQHAGLTSVRTAQRTSLTVPAGNVIATNPVAGTRWPARQTVWIFVSAGPPLPDFVGQPLQAAQQQAGQGGYTIQPVTDAHGAAPAGTIVGQSPRPGTPITPREVVTVRVSPGPRLVAVPDVRGMFQHEAVQLLVEAGFRVHVHKFLGLGGRVLSYSPAGKAPKGATITINVAPLP